MKKKKKLTSNWSYRYRTINGKRKKVKCRRVGGREQIRVIGYYNTTDKRRSRRIMKKKK